MHHSLDRSWGPNAGAALPVAIEVLRRGPVSRADIGRRLSLSHASLSRLTTPLIERGIIVDIGEQSDGKVGRPSRLLDVDPASHYFLGIKIREHEMISAVTNLRGDVVESGTSALLTSSPSNAVEIVQQFHTKFSEKWAISGIGIGIGGSVQNQRIVKRAGFLNWQNVPLADLIEAATQTPVLIENDIIALCEYEDWFGSARNDDRFAVITLGIGTGFGFVVNGVPITDEDYGIGLVGHWPMDSTGPFCHLGHRGCAASLLNSDAIARYVSEATGQETSFDGAIELAKRRHPAAERIIYDAATGLGVLVAAICNLIIPQRIIIAGEGVQLARVGHKQMLDSAKSLRAAEAQMPPIEFSTGGNVEWARGAAVLAIQSFALGKNETA